MLSIVKKEVKELLTVKNVIPIIAITLVFVFIGQSIGDIDEEAEKKPTIGMIDEDNSSLSKIIAETFDNRSEVVYFSQERGDIQEAVDEVKEEEGVALIVIPSNFGENIRENNSGRIRIRWFVEGVGVMESIPTEVVNSLIQMSGERISRGLIENSGGLNSDIVLNPTTMDQTTYFQDREFKGISPGEISGALSSYSTLVPIVIMIIILMSGSQVIQSMGMEKGNKTLETLLTLPVERRNIAIGKIIGSAVVGLLMAAIYMVGFGYYMTSFQPETVNLAEAGMALGMFDYLLLGLSLALTIIAGLTLCMLMGTFAKDYRSSQMLMFPLMILVFIPFFLSMFKSFYTLPSLGKVLMFMIPFSHPMMAVRFLLFDNYILVIGGIGYVSLFTGFSMALVSYIFQTDTLLTGRFKVEWINRIVDVFKTGNSESK